VDLEKAFDHVLREVVHWSLQKKGNLMYEGAKTRVEVARVAQRV